LLERAGLLASARGARTLFVRNLNFNAALRRLAHRVGMQVACAPSARSTRLELPAASQGRLGRGSVTGTITLADYSLRSQWNRTAAADSPTDELPERMET
jgi:hypothetical protein